MRSLVLLLALGALLAPERASAAVFHSKESALRLAFPDADSVTVRDLFLSDEEAGQVERAARSPVESRLVSVYVGHRDSRVTGYAFFDTHRVRTLPETFLLVLGPAGRVRGTHLLAFHEPPEYQPPARWLERFAGRVLDDDLALGRDVDGITGSTLTAHALTAAVRRLLAVHRVKLAPENGVILGRTETR